MIKLKLVVLFLFCWLFDKTYSQEPKAKIDEYFYYKCYNHTKKLEVFNKLSSDSNELVESLRLAFFYIPEHGEEFCNKYRKELNIKAIQVAEDLKPCLSSREQFLSDFFKTSFKEFTHFWCHNDRDYMKRLFGESNRICRNSLENDENIMSKVNNCLGRIFRPSSGYPTQKEVCDGISVAEKCFETILNEKCTHSSSYRHLNKRFFEYIRKPCSGCIISQINILLLIVSVTLSYGFGKN